MKEDSIKEDIKNAEHFIKSIKTDKEYKEENGWHGYYNKEIVDLARISEHILSDYKRVLKENEEINKIKEQKECTFREYGAEEGLWYCSNCHDEWLFYEGTPEENNLKYCPHCGAKVTKYENYIEGEIEAANKMEEDLIEKLQKENEELNKYTIHLTDEQYKTVIDLAQNDINQQWIQKVKDKIEELKQEKKKYGNCLIEMYEDELVNRDIKILQELLEGRK